ncbi:MAG: energy-coupling factor ABC transporter permease [Stomatobaculum sp.]|nr:energy-coupling factor ABC transporter permease [Stomatobaculum sp.]
MHMSDALLSPAVGAVMYGVTAAAIAKAVKETDAEELGQQRLPLMAVSGAFVFAAQMINFTIPGTGSSGHICGGILLAGLLGGGPALLTIASVLLIQCLFFADGGLLALGANIFNMGVIPCLLIYPLLVRPLSRRMGEKGMPAVTVISCIAGLELGAFCVVLETLVSGITELPVGVFMGLMLPIHLAIGFVEGLITAAVFACVKKTRPELLSAEDKPVGSLRSTVVMLAVFAVLTGGGLSLLASGYPDGLEWSMERTAGTAELERNDAVHDAAAAVQEAAAVLPDYDFKAGEGTGTSASGLIGGLMTCVLAGAAGGAVVLAKRRSR